MLHDFFKFSYKKILIGISVILLLLLILSMMNWFPFSGDEQESPSGFPSAGAINLSPDGKQAVFLFPNQNPQLWDVITQQPLLELAQTSGNIIRKVNYAVFSEGNQYLATIFSNGFGVWDLIQKKQLYYYNLPQGLRHFCLNAEGNTAILGLEDYSIQKIDLTTQTVLSTFPAGGEITGLSCDQNAGLVLIGTQDNSAVLWDSRANLIMHTWQFTLPVTTVVLSPQANHALIVAGPYEARVWDMKTYEEVVSLHRRDHYFKFTYKELLMFTTADFSHDGNYLAVGTPGGMIQLWDLESQDLVKRWSFVRNRGWPPRPNYAIAVSFDPQAHHLVTVSSQTKINFWAM